MQFDDFEVNDDELNERLSSWRRDAGVAGQLPASLGEVSINEAEVRMRQRRTANMCLNTVRMHDAFVADLLIPAQRTKGMDLSDLVVLAHGKDFIKPGYQLAGGSASAGLGTAPEGLEAT